MNLTNYFDFNFLLDQNLSPGLDKREDTTDYHSLGTVLPLEMPWVAKHHELTGLHTKLVLQVDMLNLWHEEKAV